MPDIPMVPWQVRAVQCQVKELGQQIRFRMWQLGYLKSPY